MIPSGIKGGTETWLPLRRANRLDRTRLSWVSRSIDPFFARAYAHRLRARLELGQFDAVHVIPHAVYDWQVAAEFCRQSKTPILMNVHDDIRHTFPGSVYRQYFSTFKRVWNDATRIFCISEELGREYCDRFGERAFQVLTDGVSEFSESPRPVVQDRLNLYFCGLLNYSYVSNFQSVGQAIVTNPRFAGAKLVIRGGIPFREMRPFEKYMTVLPFANDISGDMDEADLLYLPLPFGDAYADFVRYSMSTKLVTYLSSRIPILYHGPRDSALGRLIEMNDAAICCFTPELVDLGNETFSESARLRVTTNALELGRRKFKLENQRLTLRQAINDVCAKPTSRTIFDSV